MSLAAPARYHADELDVDEILEAAWDGARVLIVPPNLGLVRPLLIRLEAGLSTANHDGVKVYRANGLERITFPSGGRIMFRSWRGHGQSLHGLVVDRAYLLELGDVPDDDWDDLLAVLLPGMMISLDPRLVMIGFHR